MAVPAVSVYVGIAVMQLSTMFFAGHIGLRELSIFGLANGFFTLCFLFCVGVNVAGGVLTGERYGERNDKEITKTGVQSIWVAFGVGGFCLAIVPAIPYILTISNQDGSIIEDVQQLTATIMLGLPFLSVFSTVRSFLTSISHPYILLRIIPPAVLLNGVLLFIFVDAFHMGLMGLAVAFVVNNIVFCGWSIVVCHTDPNSKKYRIFHIRNLLIFDWNIIKRILKIGVPSGIAIFAEGAAFQVLLFMAGSLGIVSLNACQIGIQIGTLCVMISVGVGQVTMARISNATGAREYSRVALISSSSILMLGAVVLTFGALVLVFREQIALLFLSRVDYITFSETLNLTLQILTLSAFTQIFDNGQTACSYCLRGVRDTKIPMYIILICYWPGGILLAYLFGFTLSHGIIGAWVGFSIGIFLTNLILGIRTWNTIRKYKAKDPLPMILSHKAT